MGLALSVIFASGLGVGVLAYGSWKYEEELGLKFRGPLNQLGGWIASVLFPFELRKGDWGVNIEGFEKDPGARPPAVLCKNVNVRIPGAVGGSGFYKSTYDPNYTNYRWDEKQQQYKADYGIHQLYAKGTLVARPGGGDGKLRTPVAGLGPVDWGRKKGRVTPLSPENYVSARLARPFGGQAKYARDRADLDGYYFFQDQDGVEVPWLPPAKHDERAIKPTHTGRVGSDGFFYAPSDEAALQRDIENMRRDGKWHWANVRQFPKHFITNPENGPGPQLNWEVKGNVPPGFKAYDFANYGTEGEYATLEWLPSNKKNASFRDVNEGTAQRWRPDWTADDYRTYIAAMLNWNAIHWKDLSKGVAKQRALHKASRKELF